MSSQHETPTRGALPPLRTLGDVRATLRTGHGAPGDLATFEQDLQRALEASSEADLTAVAAVIRDYRGRILPAADPEHNLAMQEAEEELDLLKRGGA